jgi:D-3-phosphoglycerate dehydrogenase
MAPRVLIADELSPAAVAIFKDRGIQVDVKPGLTKDQLLEIIDQYDGLAVRSATKPNKEVIAKAKNLKVIGRAGIGVDNVDIPAATAAGIVVMNTPFGNSITTAEHAIALMFAVARQLPAADLSTQAGKWEKNRFMGVELFGKTLGLIGAGNIGSIVADRALGLKMKVIAYDPFLSAERAVEIGVEKVELDQLLARADFITLHTPMTDKTRNILSREALAKTKKGVVIINCARGGLVDEAALRELLDSDQCAVRRQQFRGHPAPGRLHQRSPGKRGPSGGRADVGLSADRRGDQRPEQPLGQRRGRAQAEAVPGPGGKTGRLRRSDGGRGPEVHRDRL